MRPMWCDIMIAFEKSLLILPKLVQFTMKIEGQVTAKLSLHDVSKGLHLRVSFWAHNGEMGGVQLPCVPHRCIYDSLHDC